MTLSTISLFKLESLAAALKKDTNDKAKVHSRSMQHTLDVYETLEMRRSATRHAMQSRSSSDPVGTIHVSELISLREQIRRDLLSELTKEYPDVNTDFQFDEEWANALKFYHDLFDQYDTDVNDKDIGKRWRRKIGKDGSMHFGLEYIITELKKTVKQLFTFFRNQALKPTVRQKLVRALKAHSKKKSITIRHGWNSRKLNL